jgi:hypothetical protein
MWRSLRWRVAENQSASLALCPGELEIMFLSAEHWFWDVSMRITDYAGKMTGARADDLCGMWRANYSGLARRFANAETVAGGIPVKGQVIERTAYKVMFSYRTTLAGLPATEVPGLERPLPKPLR